MRALQQVDAVSLDLAISARHMQGQYEEAERLFRDTCQSFQQRHAAATAAAPSAAEEDNGSPDATPPTPSHLPLHLRPLARTFATVMMCVRLSAVRASREKEQEVWSTYKPRPQGQHLMQVERFRLEQCAKAEKRAQALFRQMSAAGVAPTLEAYNTLLLILADAALRATVKVRRVLARMRAEGVHPDTRTLSLAICALAGEADAVRAQRVPSTGRTGISETGHRNEKKPDDQDEKGQQEEEEEAATPTAAAHVELLEEDAGVLSAEKTEKETDRVSPGELRLMHSTCELYEEALRLQALSKTAPDPLLFGAALVVMCRLHNVAKAIGIYRDCKRLRVSLSASALNELIRLLVVHRDLEAATAVFDDMGPVHGVAPALTAYNRLIFGYRTLSADRCLGLLEQMQQRGVEPDAFSYEYVLRACGYHAKGEPVDRLWKEVVTRGLRPTVRLYEALMECLQRCKRSIEAAGLVAVMEGQGLKPTDRMKALLREPLHGLTLKDELHFSQQKRAMVALASRSVDKLQGALEKQLNETYEKLDKVQRHLLATAPDAEKGGKAKAKAKAKGKGKGADADADAGSASPAELTSAMDKLQSACKSLEGKLEQIERARKSGELQEKVLEVVRRQMDEGPSMHPLQVGDDVPPLPGVDASLLQPVGSLAFDVDDDYRSDLRKGKAKARARAAADAVAKTTEGPAGADAKAKSEVEEAEEEEEVEYFPEGVDDKYLNELVALQRATSRPASKKDLAASRAAAAAAKLVAVKAGNGGSRSRSASPRSRDRSRRK